MKVIKQFGTKITYVEVSRKKLQGRTKSWIIHVVMGYLPPPWMGAV